MAKGQDVGTAVGRKDAADIRIVATMDGAVKRGALALMGERVQTPRHETKVERRLDRERSGRTVGEKVQIQTGVAASL